MVNIEEEIQLLEDAATNAVVEFETTIMERKKFEEANAQLIEEKAALMKRIEVEQGDLSSYTERQAKVAAQKADMEAQVLVMKEKLAAEEEKKETFLAEKKAIEQEASSVRGELCDLEVAVSKVEQERSTKDHAIRSLNDEIAAKDELINKLNKVSSSSPSSSTFEGRLCMCLQLYFIGKEAHPGGEQQGQRRAAGS